MSYPVGLISQFMSKPIDEHFQCAQRILRYVSGTKDMALFYRTGIAERLLGYRDADWDGNAHDRRSTSGYAFSLGSVAIVWSSKKQPTVALSSTKAEYRGAIVATCEVMWLKRLLRDLPVEVSDPTTIFCDNLSSTHLAKNPVFHARTKHIEVHYHFVRERVLSGEVELTHVSTDRQIADIFTKPHGLDKLRHFSGELGLRQFDTPNSRGRKEQEEECTLKEREEKCMQCRGHHGGSDRDVEWDEEFDFGEPAEEAEGSKDRNLTEEPKTVETGGDKVKEKMWSDVLQDLRIEAELETANSVKSEIESDLFDSIEMFHSDTPNRLMAKRRKGQRGTHQRHGNKRAKKGQQSRQPDQNGRSTRNRTGRGARARREARRNRSIDPVE